MDFLFECKKICDQLQPHNDMAVSSSVDTWFVCTRLNIINLFLSKSTKNINDRFGIDFEGMTQTILKWGTDRGQKQHFIEFNFITQ